MHGQTTLNVILTLFSWQNCFLERASTLHVDSLSCSSSVYRHTVTLIPVQANAVRYQSSTVVRGENIRCIHQRCWGWPHTCDSFISLHCPALGTQQLWRGVAQQMEAFCAIHLSCSGTHYNGHSIYLLLPILISGGEESLEPGSHVTSKRQVHGSRHLLQRGAASSAGWRHNTDEPSQAV